MFNFRDLIDLAIGSPESGHVNFYALHVLLSNMAQRLGILDDEVECDEVVMGNFKGQSSMIGRSSKYRLYAGADIEEEDEEGQVPAGEPEQEVPPEPASEPPPPPPEEIIQDEPEPAEEPAAQPVEETPVEVEPPPPEVIVEEETAQEAAEQEPVEEQIVPSVPISTAPSVRSPAATGSPAGGSPVAGTAPGTVAGTAGGTAAGTAVPSVQPSRDVSRRSLEDQRCNPKAQISRTDIQKTLELAETLTVMGNHVRLTIEQLNNVTHLLLDRKPDPERVKQLRELAMELRALLQPDIKYSSWISIEQMVEEAEAEVEEEDLELPSSGATKEPEEPEEESLELEQHLCYTTERMLNELLELKSDFCALTNKVNELAAGLLKQDCQRLMQMMQEVQEQIRDLKLSANAAREAFESMTIKVNNAVAEIQQLKKGIINLEEVKIDKTEVEILLAEKVDFEQFQTKVSIEQLDEFKAKLEKQFCEVRAIMNVNEKNVLHMIDNLRTTLGLDTLELNLKDFRDMIEKRVTMLAESLQRYMDMTNDDCAAAAGRVKVLQDLACLSCDTACVMRTVERTKVGKLPNATASTSMAPLVTYELGSIRKSGVMGYYRKDEFPHAQDAWLKGTKQPMNLCVPRHAGGQHTVHTADEHMQKVILSKRNTGYGK